MFVCFLFPHPGSLPHPPPATGRQSLGTSVSSLKCPFFFGAFFLQLVILWTSGRKDLPQLSVALSRSLVNSPFILFTFSGLLLRALSLPASCFNSSAFLHQRASTHLSFPLLPAFKGQDQRSPLLWSCGRFPDWQERLYSLSFHIDFSWIFF